MLRILFVRDLFFPTSKDRRTCFVRKTDQTEINFVAVCSGSGSTNNVVGDFVLLMICLQQ